MIQSPGLTSCPQQTISVLISPKPFGSPAFGAVPRAKTGNPISLMSSTSLTAPSITMPTIPRFLAEWVASSPQGAICVPPSLLMTRTSPGLARSIASTGFAQSPAMVLTVTAWPTAFVRPQMETIPVMAPFRCMASVTFGAETASSSWRMAASGLSSSRGLISGRSIASLIRRAAPVTSAALMMFPPTMTIEAPAATASDAVSAPSPPATAMGMFTSPARRRRRSSDDLPIICWSIPT